MNGETNGQRSLQNPPQKLAGILESILNRIEAGDSIDIESLKLQHPDIANELEQCVDNLHFIEDAVRLVAKDQTAESQHNEDQQEIVFRQLGDYKLIREIGRGGMGVVFEAEQISLRRHVALKVLPFAALLDHRAVQRFQNEVAAAAQLEHPNIVDVYAVACDKGVYHYAMRLIRGSTVAQIIADLRIQEKDRRWSTGFASNSRHLADQVSISTQAAKPVTLRSKPSGYFRSVAQFGVSVARALDYAHDHGIVHRDIKPPNLLIDNDAKAWVTDFGVAQLETGTSMTVTGDLLGTARYMSPEQILAKRVVLDHRTDIYSLGVTLYESLTLEHPFDSDDRQELFRQITFEPARPMREIQPAIPVDLETIVLKAMEKSAADRYQTAGELADDLQRFLDQKSILAKRPSAFKWIKKWTVRNPAVVYSTFVTLGLLTVASIIFSIAIWDAKLKAQQNLQVARRALAKEKEANEQANRSLKQVEKGVDLLASIFFDINPRHEESLGLSLYVQLAERVAKAADMLESESVGNALAVARLQSDLGLALTNLGDADKAISILEKASATQRQKLGVQHPDTRKSILRLATAYLQAGRSNKALPFLKQAVEVFELNVGPDDEHTLNIINKLGTAYLDAGYPGQALPLLEKTLEGTTAKYGPEHLQAIACKNNLASVYLTLGKPANALPLLDQILNVLEKQLGPDHHDTLIVMSNLASAHDLVGNDDKALNYFQRALKAGEAKLGSDHPSTLTTANGLAMHYIRTGKTEQALPLFENTLKALTAKLGTKHHNTLTCMSNLADAYRKAGLTDKAITLEQKALDLMKSELGENNHMTLGCMTGLTEAYLEAKSFSAAEKQMRTCLEIRERIEPESWNTFYARLLLGAALLGLEDFDQAEVFMSDGYEGLKQRESTISLIGKQDLQRAIGRIIRRYEEKDEEKSVDAWRNKLSFDRG